MGSTKLFLPPKGALVPTGDSDPLEYYYVPLVGRLYVNRINITLNLLPDNFTGTILEIGYGSGVLLPTLCKLSNDVYGVDIDSDPELVTEKLSRIGCYPKLSQGVEQKLLFQDETFDLIVAISVLEHIREIQSFLAEIYRVLKPGGLLLVGMPAVNKTMDYLFRAIGFSEIGHHHVTTPEDMCKAAKLMFKLKGISHMPGFLPSNIYLYKSFSFKKI